MALKAIACIWKLHRSQLAAGTYIKSEDEETLLIHCIGRHQLAVSLASIPRDLAKCCALSLVCEELKL